MGDVGLHKKHHLHTNASGDYFLMAKSNWLRLNGYPEFKTHSHIDAYMCVISASGGLQQVVLKGRKRIYHQEHDRSEHRKRPLTDPHEFFERRSRMLETGRPEMFND